MTFEYKVKEWHTGAVHSGETGALGLQAMLNEPELFGYHLHTVLGGLDQSLLIFARQSGEAASPKPEADRKTDPDMRDELARRRGRSDSLVGVEGDDARVRHVLGPSRPVEVAQLVAAGGIGEPGPERTRRW